MSESNERDYRTDGRMLSDSLADRLDYLADTMDGIRDVVPGMPRQGTIRAAATRLRALEPSPSDGVREGLESVRRHLEIADGIGWHQEIGGIDRALSHITRLEAENAKLRRDVEDYKAVHEIAEGKIAENHRLLDENARLKETAERNGRYADEERKRADENRDLLGASELRCQSLKQELATAKAGLEFSKGLIKGLQTDLDSAMGVIAKLQAGGKEE